ncbi:MAG: hypothetical protein RIM72_23465 [Alphaproteobacteria bacterium]
MSGMTNQTTELNIDISGDAMERVRSGYPLIAHLEPDHAIETFDERQPPYRTSIALPYVVRRGNAVWGFSGPSILSHSLGQGIYGLNAFGFTNIGPFYAILSYTSSMDALSQQTVAIRLIPIASLRKFSFQTAPQSTLVWHSKDRPDTAALGNAVDGGAMLSACVEIDDDVAMTARVAAAYCRLNGSGFELRTHLELFPAFALASDGLLTEITARNPDLMNASVRTARPFHLNDSVLSTFLCAASDGTFYSVADIPAARRQRYHQMTVRTTA